jgi:hypothetical protein
VRPCTKQTAVQEKDLDVSRITVETLTLLQRLSRLSVLASLQAIEDVQEKGGIQTRR